MTKNTVAISSLEFGREEKSSDIYGPFFSSSSLDNYLGADNLGTHTGIPVSKCLWIRHWDI